MRGFFLNIIIAGMGILLIGNTHAADPDTVKRSLVGEQQIQDIREKDEDPDQIQKKFITDLKKINADLRNKHSAFAKNYSFTKANQEKMNSQLEWGGDVSSQVIKSLQDLEAEKTRLEAEIKGLDREKAYLRADILSFYGGKVPKWLTEQWDKEEKTYRDYVETTYIKVQWLWGSPKRGQEEKEFRDYIQEYYRLRQQ